MDREYFRAKKTGKKIVGTHTKCCNNDKDIHILNKKKPIDWKLIEEYCEEHLNHFPNHESIVPICCKKCGRLLEYKINLKKKINRGK
jgi:hypothetical protein